MQTLIRTVHRPDCLGLPPSKITDCRGNNNQPSQTTMMAERQYGVTPALSMELPTEPQLQASESLLEELRRQGTFESPAETQKR